MSYNHALLFQAVSICLQRNPSWSLIDLSRDLRVGRRTIQAVVRIKSGKTFRQFREEILIERVNNSFLARPMLAIKELSFELGYPFPQSFARSVKRACGLSPEQLRSTIVSKCLGSRNLRASGLLVANGFSSPVCSAVNSDST